MAIGSTSASGVPAASASSSTMIPSWSVPIATSSSARIMPLDSWPRSLAFLRLRAVGHHRAGPGDRDGLAGGDVRRAADDLRRLARAGVDEADAEPVGVRVAAGLEHLADDEVLERGDAVRVHAVDLGPGQREPGRELERLEPGVAVVVEPEQRQPHPNCSRKRRSFSYMSRRSLTPCLRKAIRSIPIPNAKPWIRSGS